MIVLPLKRNLKKWVIITFFFIIIIFWEKAYVILKLPWCDV